MKQDRPVTTALAAAGEGTVALTVDRSDADERIDIMLRYVATAALDHGASSLGMHFARRMAELHGGSVKIEADGAGARVLCQLPAGPVRAASVG